ncbi:hypothetical protein [Maribacter sp. 4G9]|uniref:hypothetical protein n=1 Tax=Maribacter sp. 4G9 TaxID=1889777 RepID=UPI000C15AB75|nr:hypothetical protein [Maribacter sp. 4G9]PIB31437.1 hypothetical protein BFP75_01435 [Maribacter sp. 4G9]
MKEFKENIVHCFELIERKLDRGLLKSWNTDDFRILSEAIQQSTGTLLSVSTLKRLSGKVYYDSKPNSTTLNALAKYVGFKDWRTFLNSNNSVKPQEVVKTNKGNLIKYGSPILLLVIGLAILLIIRQKEKAYDPDDFVFESRSVSIGIPNSVVFDYDARAAGENSKIEIQQYWDETKRITINKDDSVATSIYYHPGFFKSKLVIDDSIVKENDVFIPTDGWLGMIEQETRPIYLNKSDILKENTIAIHPETVWSHNLDPRTAQVVVGLYQVKDFGELYTDNFEMITSIKNDFKEGLSGACQRAVVYILYDGGAIGIPLSKKGCISELTLMTFEEFLDGKKNDLSGFGVDFTEYVELQCISRNQQLEMLINGNSVYQVMVPQPALKIKGITIQFEGAGSVKNLVFKKGNEVVYTSDF